MKIVVHSPANAQCKLLWLGIGTHDHTYEVITSAQTLKIFRTNRVSLKYALYGMCFIPCFYEVRNKG